MGWGIYPYKGGGVKGVKMFLQQVDFETREKIEKLLVFYKKEEGNFPINIYLLIELLSELIDCRIELVEVLEKPKTACILPIEYGFRIFINNKDSIAEKRFSVGHEIGHILYSFDYDLYLVPQQKPERQSAMIFPNKGVEQICDKIAGYIFCPSDLLVDFLEHFDEIPYQYQLELFTKKQESIFLHRMNFVAKKFGIPLTKLYRYMVLQFGKEKILSLINSAPLK